MDWLSSEEEYVKTSGIEGFLSKHTPSGLVYLLSKAFVVLESQECHYGGLEWL